MFKILYLLIALFLVSCSSQKQESNLLNPTAEPTQEKGDTASVVKTPTVLLLSEEWPKIEDDLDHEWMILALDRQIAKFKRMKSNSRIKLGSIVYSFDVFLTSLEKYRALVANYRLCQITINRLSCKAHFARSVKKYFHMFAPVEKGEIKKAFFTAYHTPQIQASLVKSKTFNVGIHLKPIEDSLRTSTRNQINFEAALEGTSYEAMYMEDQFDQYLLHIQGGGKVLYKDFDGQIKTKYLNYDGTNQQSLRFISKYMKEKGYIKDLSVASQRRFLAANPEKQREIYSYSPSYVYFKFSDEPPHGNDAVSLTDNRSIATDYRIYKLKGLLTYVQTERPIKDAGKVKWIPMNRFMIDHDTGGAIRGPARGDLYFGETKYAAWVATQMKRRGYKYFLALKPEYL